MSDSADDLILKMQHLEAQARESMRAKGLGEAAERLKAPAQRLALQAQKEVSAAEAEQAEGERKVAEAKQPGKNPLDAAELLKEGKAQLDHAKHALIAAHARLNLALDRMDAAERREYEAFHAEVRAETHGHLVDET